MTVELFKNTSIDSKKEKSKVNLKSECIYLMDKIVEHFKRKKELFKEKSKTKSIILLNKQISDNIYRRNKEDLNIFMEKQEELNIEKDKKSEVLNKQELNLKEVQIFARREFQTHKDPYIAYFNSSVFVNWNVILEFDIKQSKEFLSSLIDDIVMTKQILANCKNDINSVVNFSPEKRRKDTNIFDENDNKFYNNSNFKICELKYLNKIKSFSFSKKEIELICYFIINNLKIINRIENLKFIIKYYIQKQFQIRRKVDKKYQEDKLIFYVIKYTTFKEYYIKEIVNDYFQIKNRELKMRELAGNQVSEQFNSEVTNPGNVFILKHETIVTDNDGNNIEETMTFNKESFMIVNESNIDDNFFSNINNDAYRIQDYKNSLSFSKIENKLEDDQILNLSIFNKS